MYKFRLDADETILILAPRWSELETAWQFGLLAVLLFVPLSLIFWLYRYELRLIARLPASGLLALRLLILFVLWLAVGLQPHLVKNHIEETPGRVRIAVDLSASMDVADPQRTDDEKSKLARALKLDPGSDGLTRKQVVARVLGGDGVNLLQRLAIRHQVEIVGFHQEFLDMPESQLNEFLSDRTAKPTSSATDLHQPLTRVVSTSKQPLLGIVLFSDGQHNTGPSPFERADELGKQRIPVFPVALGSREPPNDLMILDVQAPSKVFKDANVAVEIRCKVTNMPAQEMKVEMQIDAKKVLPEHRTVFQHTGKDDTQTVRFEVKMDVAGAHTLSIKATSKDPKEITLANNQVTRVLRVAEDKAKVLLVDGEARWEYHYLANALLRDPTIALERVVFTQPRIGALKEDQLDKAGLPKLKLPEVKGEGKEIDPLHDYDCILLGDVSPEQLPLADRRRLENYVSERGGTLILLAGKRYLPLAYTTADDPLVKMLPITEPRVLAKETGFTLRVSSEGKLRPFLQLEPDQPGKTWPDLPKHFWGVVGKRKPAASVLLTPVLEAAGDGDTGILLQQNYGFGRVLYFGLDSTWRWRQRTGDEHHHRFWGQLARWSAAEKLLPAGNRFIRYGPREPVYAEGQEVELATRLSEALPPLTESSPKQAKLFRKNADGAEELVAVMPLSKNPRQANLLEAKARDLQQGTYRMELDIPAYRTQLAETSDEKEGPTKGRDLFRIVPREERELLDLSTNWSLMQGLADRSDGTLYTPENVEEIVDRLGRRIERKDYRDESKPWQDVPMVWWMLSLLLTLLTLEWSWRKWLDLP